MTSASDRLASKPEVVVDRWRGGAAVFRALTRAVQRDRYVQLTLLLYAALAVLYVAPFSSVEQRQAWIASFGPTLAFLALLLAALRAGIGRIADSAERRFWGDLSVAVGCWIAAVLFTLAAPLEIALVISGEACYAAYYVAFVLALGRLPHLRPEERPQGGLLALPSFAIFAAGLFAYFAVIPLIANRREYDSQLPTTYLYLVLDAFIIVKLVELCCRSQPARWRAHYLLLAATTALFFYNDLYNLPFYAAHTDRPWRLPEALLWNLQFVLLVVAVRLRHQPFPGVAVADSQSRDAFAEARESTLVVALLFPCVHFAAYVFGYLDQPSKPPRDVLMLVWLCALGSVAMLQHRRLERRHAFLDEGTVMMSAEIAWREEMTREQERLIAELSARNTELAARNAEMQRYHYSLSHDLKNPLVTIRGFLGVLKRQAVAGEYEVARRTLLRIRGAADTMSRLLEQVLELARIGRQEDRSEEISMIELAREAACEVTGWHRPSDLGIEISPDLPAVRGSRSRLGEALRELIDNAVKFMGQQPRPRIEVGCRAGDEGRVFYVRDNGNGIDERYREKVFDLFDRLDQRVAGTGFGLTRVRKIVEMHGGRVWVESEGPEGSTFCFTLGREAGPESSRGLGASPSVAGGAEERS